VGEHLKETAMATVRLRDIVSPADRAAVMRLRRGPGQDQYLNSMEEIFAEADEEQRAMPHPWAVHDAGTGALIGFAMISDNIPQRLAPEERRSRDVVRCVRSIGYGCAQIVCFWAPYWSWEPMRMTPCS
jgi:hypothetical protein